MLSEHLSHDSKVWTKEYDLDGVLIEETGEKGDDGHFIYDDLPEYKYVDVEYDTYKYVRKTPKAAATKTLCGKEGLSLCAIPCGEASDAFYSRRVTGSEKSNKKANTYMKKMSS